MLELSLAEYYVLGVMATALVLILSNRFAPDLVALLVLLALGISGVTTLDQTLAGFSSPAVVTIIGLFVITGALESTGVIRWLSRQLARLSGKTELRIVTVLTSAGALLSLVVNNIAAGAVLLPAALQVAGEANVRPSRVLLPLAFGTLVGGMATLFTTANILLSSFLQRQGQPPLTMTDFLITGGPVALAGIAYVALVGRHWLPERESALRTRRYSDTTENLPETYQLDERMWEVYVPPQSWLVGKTLEASRIGAELGVTVIGIIRDQHIVIVLQADDRIDAHDTLLIVGREERVRRLEQRNAQVRHASEQLEHLHAATLPPHEVIIAPRAPMIGQTLNSLDFRTRYGLSAVALWRGGRSYRTDIDRMPFQAGDALLMIGPADRLEALSDEPGYIVPDDSTPPPDDPRKARRAAIIGSVAIGLAIVGAVATPLAMLLGAAAIALMRLLHMSEIYRVIEWRIIFLIAGMAPLSAAMQNTGLASKFSSLFTGLFEPLGALGLIAGFYLLTFLVVQFLGGQVTALVVGPLAVAAALEAQVNPGAMGVAVSIACSASFLTPVAHPVNLLMMAPGSYTPGDFLRIGSGMSLVCFVALLVSLSVFWQL